jgi:hypothetical protein
MHSVQNLKQNCVDRHLENDQKSIEFIAKITLEDIVAKTDVDFCSNQFGDMHFGEVVRENLKIALRQSEKTRHGNYGQCNFIDLIYAFDRVEVLNDEPGGGLQLVITRDEIPTVLKIASGPVGSTHSALRMFKQDATNWLDQYYPDGVGEIVILSANGDSDSWARPESIYEGRVFRQLFGAAGNEFLTGHANPTELIDRQVTEMLRTLRPVCPYQRNNTLIDRKVMELQAEALVLGNHLHGFRLLDDVGCPLWNNWRQAKERISITKYERKVQKKQKVA